jgi:uncharacterized protein YxeA
MKKLLKVFVIILAIVVALFSWNWFSAKRALADYVHKVQPGMQVTEARSYAMQKGLKYVISSYKDEAGRFRDLVTATGVMGRYVCEVQHDGTVVVKVNQRFHD